MCAYLVHGQFAPKRIVSYEEEGECLLSSFFLSLIVAIIAERRRAKKREAISPVPYDITFNIDL